MIPPRYCNHYARKKWQSSDGGEKKIPVVTARDHSYIIKLFLFPHMIFITVHEFVDPSCGVNKFHLTGIERM